MQVLVWVKGLSAGGKSFEFNHERTVLSKTYDCYHVACSKENEKCLREEWNQENCNAYYRGRAGQIAMRQGCRTDSASVQRC